MSIYGIDRAVVPEYIRTLFFKGFVDNGDSKLYPRPLWHSGKGRKSRPFLLFNNIGEAVGGLLIFCLRVSPGPLKISLLQNDYESSIVTSSSRKNTSNWVLWRCQFCSSLNLRIQICEPPINSLCTVTKIQGAEPQRALTKQAGRWRNQPGQLGRKRAV